jgi:rfaE bifunctional protein kinase chain/domain
MQTVSCKLNWLESVLAGVSTARVAVIGDFCVDAYWQMDTGPARPSLETGLPVRCVRSQRYGLGGAGNVVANLIDLGVKEVRAIGLTGDDPWGRELMRLLDASGADVSGMVVGDRSWQTTVYAKPYLNEMEENRIDFGAFNQVSELAGDALIKALDSAAGKSDVVVINQQFQSGLGETRFVTRLNRLIASHPETRFIVDSRDAAGLFRGAILKLNSSEVLRLVNHVQDSSNGSAFEAVSAAAVSMSDRIGQPIFVTRGERGIVVADGANVSEIPGIQIVEQTDAVGAGDTVVAAVAAAIGSGSDAVAAARFANIAAAITVKKLRMTGTATQAEILAVGPTPDYVYAPDLADNPRAARYAPGSEIELVRDLPGDIQIRHAIFDHDGTISTLREGWEKIMEPMMIRAVLGSKYDDVPVSTFESVRRMVRDFIDKTTGVQTLVQMQGLVELVRRGGFVPEEEIRNEHEYKAIYNEQLLKMVRDRIAKLNRGELVREDFQIKNAHLFLRRLREKGVKLYLASGTDEADVVAEARALGYADLFEGRIFGAVRDVTVEAKKKVLEQIIREHDLAGYEFATFGDGPVEMRETHKRGGICVGVCSDEVRRFGFNPAKRTRLIRGGAGLLVGDFSQMDRLLELLKLA